MKLPDIDDTRSKLSTLKRRRTYLKGKLSGEYAHTPSASYDFAEVAALEAAIDCLCYVYFQSYGEDITD